MGYLVLLLAGHALMSATVSLAACYLELFQPLPAITTHQHQQHFIINKVKITWENEILYG